MTDAPVFTPGPEHRRIVALTGAGLSAIAGLPTFRGPGGLWNLDPELERAMDASALPGSIPALWELWPPMAGTAREHGPGPGHPALARLGAAVITQNVDGLHQAAGSTDVTELHGSAGRARCLDPACAWSAELTPGRGRRAEDHGAPASCPVCGAPTRPDVVLFGEELPAGALLRAQELARRADVFVVAGTSGAVMPAAALAPLARRSGAITVLIDPRPDGVEAEDVFAHVITGDAHEVLPAWAEARAGGTPA